MSRLPPSAEKILIALADEASSGGDLARRTGLDRSTVSKYTSQLEDKGLVEIDFVIQGNSGGLAAQYWTLTEAGQRLIIRR